MKTVVQVVETEHEGLEAFLGKTVTLWCNYIYTGTLLGINATCVKLGDAKVVYETGPLGDKAWRDAQSLPGEWYVMLNAIESFGHLK